MRLIAKHEVWVAHVHSEQGNHLIVDTRHPILPPYTGARVIHLQEGDTLFFTNLPIDGSNPYRTIAEEYRQYFTLEES